MTGPRIGPDVAVFRLGWRRSTFQSEQITADIHEHVVGLVSAGERGELFRAGNVLAVDVLGTDEQDPRLLLVSTDIDWTPRNQDAVDALEAHATVRDEGRFTVVPGASASVARDEGGDDDRDGDVPVRDLGHRVHVFELRPAAGRSTQDVVAAVTADLVPLVGAPATRSGNVRHVSLLADRRSDRHLLLFGVDHGDTNRNAERLAAVGEVADMTELDTLVQHPLPAGTAGAT
jgi:hypothetical protein